MDALFLVDRRAREQQMNLEERLASRREHAEVWAEEIRNECAKLALTLLPRMMPSDKPIIHFEERPSGTPEALKAWFYPLTADR